MNSSCNLSIVYQDARETEDAKMRTSDIQFPLKMDCFEQPITFESEQASSLTLDYSWKQNVNVGFEE
ncbi:predicted protein [Botrytis cinerea T4]|uniref:Uncharacterized protein n=1 Tax=Botryotinia fuckeliana (strain T4) TaxID=999810 RepID=G2XWC3_BOTF4|nr:predicted protein [Botrytis cinerea T4]